MTRFAVIDGHNHIQATTADGEHVDGMLAVDLDAPTPDGGYAVQFLCLDAPQGGQQPSEAVKGSLGEFEEVEEPVLDATMRPERSDNRGLDEGAAADLDPIERPG
jgi:hypothetical protein